MKNRSTLWAFVLMVFIGLFAAFPQTAVAATQRSTTYIAPSETNGVASRIDVFASTTGSGNSQSTTYQIYLPGCADVSECFLSWDVNMQAVVDGVAYNSGECPIPPVDTQKTYTFISGGQSYGSFQIVTYQGSASVPAVFIEIDESNGNPTIAQMDGDRNHEVTCTGTINIDGTWYELSKMKGRGNVTWNQAKDKRPYNLTLGKKINFPGIDSAKTKKWSILSEPFDKSLLGTRTAFSVANEMGVGQDATSADVWMNGEYQGCYTVTPKTDSFVTDDGYMLENDNYREDSIEQGGDPQFTLAGRNASNNSAGAGPLITVKKIGDNLLEATGYEDPESAASLRAATADIQAWMQDAWDAIRSSTGYNSKGKYYTEYIDIESFAKMYLMMEYVKSFDVRAGSILFYRNGTSDSDLLYAGPLWDVDNAMGSTQQNGGLGAADNRRDGDRRSGEGDFISNLSDTQYCIYKSLSTHGDFMLEVYRQYNIYRESFNNMPYVIDQMAADIAASARMNHIKVERVNDNHSYNSTVTLGSGQYRQTYVATNANPTVWDNFVKNLRTYVSTRSLWFNNNYNISYYGTEADGWVSLGGKKYLYLENYQALANGWAAYDSTWYYIRNYNVVKNGWAPYEDSYCYIKNYSVAKEGWASYAGSWYYIKNYLPLEEGWASYAGSWYYIKNYTVVKDGWASYNGSWYYIKNYSVLQNGWVSSGGNWYYIKNYVPVTNGWISYNGTSYHFNASGVCDSYAA